MEMGHTLGIGCITGSFPLSAHNHIWRVFELVLIRINLLPQSPGPRPKTLSYLVLLKGLLVELWLGFTDYVDSKVNL